jgi:L-ascorbate metabolism protein UlaG (beta-lactamase superfamily)
MAELSRPECAAMVAGGPTAVLDLGGLRIVSDPTFDPPGPHGYLTKTAGPAVSEGELGTVDLVLVSHDNHADNLDDRGRLFALAAPLVLTTRSGAGRLGPPAVSLAPWTSHAMDRPDGGSLTVTAVPAVHGPEDGERDADGFVNCEVIGFVLAGPDLPTVYISGDNASIRTVAEIARRIPGIDAAVLHAGAARVQSKFGDRALSLDSIRAAAAAAILGPVAVIPAHYDGWAHFSEGRSELVRAFDDAGLSAQLRAVDHGMWVPLSGLPMAGLPGEEAVRADLGEFLLDGRLIDAAGNAGQSSLETVKYHLKPPVNDQSDLGRIPGYRRDLRGSSDGTGTEPGNRMTIPPQVSEV